MCMDGETRETVETGEATDIQETQETRQTRQIRKASTFKLLMNGKVWKKKKKNSQTVTWSAKLGLRSKTTTQCSTNSGGIFTAVTI